jgi:hypothetical protein
LIYPQITQKRISHKKAPKAQKTKAEPAGLPGKRAIFFVPSVPFWG